MGIRLSRLSIRVQLLFLVLLFGTSLAGIMVFALIVDYRQAQESAQSNVTILAESVAANVAQFLSDGENTLRNIAERPKVRELDASKCDPFMNEYIHVHPEFATYSVRGVAGNIICVTAAKPFTQAQITAFPWFAEAVKRRAFTVSDSYLRTATGRWAVAMTYPVRDRAGEASGVAILPIDLLNLNKRLRETLPGIATYFAVDGANRFILRGNTLEDWLGKAMSDGFLRKSEGRRSGDFEESGISGVPRLFAFVTVPGTDWRVFAGLPLEVVLANYYARRNRSAAVGVLLLSILLLLAWKMGSAILRPINELSATAGRVAGGATDVRASFDGPPEVGAVARQFNGMLDARDASEAELRVSEARFRSLTEMSSDFFWETDREHRFSGRGAADSKTSKVRTFQSGTHFGMRRWEIPSIQPDAAGWQAHRTLLDAHLPFNDFEISRTGSDGDERHISISGVPVFDAAGNFSGYRGVGVDFTERRRVEAAHASLEAQLRESQKMEAIGTLAGGIAHDFNNIIATILGNAELAREDAGDHPAVQESLEEIRKAGTRARDLVQQILSFSRRQPTELKVTALAPVVEESARLLRATLPARVRLEVNCNLGVPAVLADATLIEQVLINLATNAMQALADRHGRVDFRLDTVLLDADLAEAHSQLSALYREHPGRTVRLSVSDDGPGMDAAIRERIFEPFFTTKDVGKGTGLGLAVVHGIVQAHAGAIVVDSAPGMGTTFTIYLPVADARMIVASEAGGPESKRAGAAHILYVDDNGAMVLFVKRLLERRGLRVSGHESPSEALDALRADPGAFDLVVSDYNMPGMSGLDVAREVREIRADLPVAIVSGFIDEKLRAQAQAAGVRELIFKATEVQEFCATVQRLASPPD